MSAGAHESLSSKFETFLFTDLEGASERWEQDPRATGGTADRLHAALRNVAARHHGAVFKTIADACCMVFQQPNEAVAAALEAQRSARAVDLGGLSVRMAVHAGQVEVRDGDYFGQAVNRVARLLSAAHGGQIIVSGIVTDLVQGALPPQASLRDLGQHRLKDLTRPEQVYQLLAPDLPAAFPPLRSLNALPNNLPQQVTSFIGRDRELAEVRSLVETNRLVTLTGSGGLGKTRIALQAGAELLGRLRDGVWILELAPLTDGALVAEMAASLFGLADQTAHPSAEAVARVLAERELLLILDNCEHLLEPARQLAAAILAHCPRVRLLATSRQALRAAGERIYRLPSLSFPARTETITASQAMTYGAVQLFVERAEAAVGVFALTDEQAPIVCEICRRLDGIPLALELAAPRLKMLTPSGLLARLKDRFRLLTGGDRTALPRHQTLKAMLEWSYNLLNGTEQLMLQRLSVFGGSWSMEAASRVTAGAGIDPAEVFDLIAVLIDKSLIVPVPGPAAEGRYRLLENTRQFALERLQAAGGGDRRRVLAEHIHALFEKAESSWQVTPTEVWLARYEPELDNVRAALEWALGEGGDALLGCRIVSRTVLLFGDLWLLSELRRWCDAARTAMGPEMAPEIEARILLAHMVDADYGDPRLEAPARRAVELCRQTGDVFGLANGLRMLGAALATPGDTQAAERHLAEAEAILRARPRTKLLGGVLAMLSVARELGGDVAAARAYAEESLAIHRTLGNRDGVQTTAANLAELEFSQGNVTGAVACAREALAAARRSGNLRLCSGILGNLAGYLLALGKNAEAVPAAQESLRLARALGWDYWVCISLEHLALAAALGRLHLAAARIAGYTDAWYRAERRVRQPTEEATFQRLRRALDEAMTPEARSAAEAEGAAWSQQQAVDAAATIG